MISKDGMSVRGVVSAAWCLAISCRSNVVIALRSVRDVASVTTFWSLLM